MPSHFVIYERKITTPSRMAERPGCKFAKKDSSFQWDLLNSITRPPKNKQPQTSLQQQRQEPRCSVGLMRDNSPYIVS